MRKYLFFNVLLITCFISSAAFAKIPAADTVNKHNLPPIRKFYIGSAMDAGVFSTAMIQHTITSNIYNPGGSPAPTTNTYGTVRFSYIINIGLTFNFNLGRHFGIYTGVDVKNIGFIEKYQAETVKQRTYNVGIPVGIKIGNMADKRCYGFFGGGIDAPINYKEKVFVIRNQKTKFNEWFSKATPSTMPYAFVGAVIPHGVSLKVQYYFNNYVNPDYTKAGYPSNNGYNVNLVLFSIGFAMPYGKHKDIVEKHISDLKTSTM